MFPRTKKFFRSSSLVAASTLGYTGASSADVGATITSAFAAGEANLGLAAAGVITMVAVLTGIGLIVSMLRK
ncbi:MAG: hypothetical protein Q7U38_04900 [Methylobacter sp.]|nr:hypothetical protein [Methylobacter sp.]MDP2098596.1 hypothetical protein [Methylobacter sp.]MDP2427255.1 hypothetical protein [Methylobacter sp.]MDP3054449.1 hypothetical protein [Methylobacter sp.]MDP3362825.1 hypothetical protein [Methylobacter sp.]